MGKYDVARDVNLSAPVTRSTFWKCLALVLFPYSYFAHDTRQGIHGLQVPQNHTALVIAMYNDNPHRWSCCLCFYKEAEDIAKHISRYAPQVATLPILLTNGGGIGRKI